jgi:hypothetical protein
LRKKTKKFPANPLDNSLYETYHSFTETVRLKRRGALKDEGVAPKKQTIRFTAAYHKLPPEGQKALDQVVQKLVEVHKAVINSVNPASSQDVRQYATQRGQRRQDI